MGSSGRVGEAAVVLAAGVGTLVAAVENQNTVLDNTTHGIAHLYLLG